MKALKFLHPGGISPYREFQWPLPKGKGPGKWVKAKGPLEMCSNGIHACRAIHAADWIEAELYTIELDGEIIAGDNKLCARRGRLVRRIDAWDQAAFAAACAWRAIGHAIRALDGLGLDTSPLRLARRRHDLRAAARAARAAAEAARAAWAARAAAEHAARAAARAAWAARAAADAARAAADAAADAAEAAAGAARAAAGAARDAAGAAAGAEKRWQSRYIARLAEGS